jgi:3-dehydroquinate synthase
VGRGVLERLARELAAEPPGRPLVPISDDRVAVLHAEPLARRLRHGGVEVLPVLRFPAGEASKIRETKARLEDQLLRLGVGRDAAILAVGGGVTGDLAGFVASTWCRGIPVVHVPTSLVAMADAALGGKTAVNARGAKNRVGTFHQPWGVYADVSLLATLPDAEYANGMAEVVKTAAVGDASLFRWLEGAVERLLARAPAAQAHAVEACLRVKARIVRRDERDCGRRAALNFGHTVAHAIEAASAYREPHGRAVALGMCAEARLACRRTGFPASHLRRLETLLAALGLPTRLPAGRRWGTRSLLAAARSDKKARAGRLRCALPRRLGRMPAGDDVTCEIDDAALSAALGALAARGPRSD